MEYTIGHLKRNGINKVCLGTYKNNKCSLSNFIKMGFMKYSSFIYIKISGSNMCINKNLIVISDLSIGRPRLQMVKEVPLS